MVGYTESPTPEVKMPLYRRLIIAAGISCMVFVVAIMTKGMSTFKWPWVEALIAFVLVYLATSISRARR